MSSQIHSSPSFSPLSTLSGVSRPPVPQQPPTELVPEDLRQLGVMIVSGAKEERELAMDILVNLAAGHDGRSKEAQAVLTDLHANPGKFADANGLQAHGKQEIRSSVLSAAHRMCELALNAGGQEGGGMPLSLTVAFLGGHCIAPPNGNVMKGLTQSHLQARLVEKGHDLPDADKLLEAGRPVSHAELAGAAAGFRNVAVHSQPLSIHTSEPAPDPGAGTPAALAGLRTALAGAHSPSCQAAWINTGDRTAPAWMPLILQKDADGNVSCHLVDVSPAGGDREAVHGKLHKLLEDAGFDQNRITLHQVHTPPNAPASDAGPLGHRLLQALDAAPTEAGNTPARNAGAMTEFIQEISKSWSGSAEPADREAMVLSARAELLEGCALQPPLAPASPAVPAATLDPAKIVAPETGIGGGAPVEAPLSATEKRELEGLIAAAGLRPRADGMQTLAGDLATAINQQIKAEPRELRTVMETQPPAVRAIAADFRDMALLGDHLKGSALLNASARGPALTSMFDQHVQKSLGESLNRLGGHVMVAQIPTRCELLVKNLSEAAEKMKSKDGSRAEKGRVDFKGLAKELAGYAEKLRGALSDSIRALKAIEDTPQYGGIRLRWANRNGISPHDPALHREAALMRKQFEILQTHLASGGLVDQWSKLGQFAMDHPGPAAESLRAAVAPPAKEPPKSPQSAAASGPVAPEPTDVIGALDVGDGFEIRPYPAAIDVGDEYEILLDPSIQER